MKKPLILFLAAVLLSGCSPTVVRQFDPELDTGYRLSDEEADATMNMDGASTAANVGAGVAGGAAGYIAPATAVSYAGAAAVGATIGLGMIAGVVAYCYVTECGGHDAYGDILLSGNVMRGEVQDFWYDLEKMPEDSWRYETLVDHPAIKDSEKAAIFAYFPQESYWSGSRYFDSVHVDINQIPIEGGELVDVFFPHLPEVERKAIIERKLFPGNIVKVVCKKDDDKCFDKYLREEDNFILGRWKTVEEYHAAYKENDGFPNKEED